MWSSKSSYTEAEHFNIHSLNGLLSGVKFRGHVTHDLLAQLDAITGEFHSVPCKVYLCDVANVSVCSVFSMANARPRN